MTCEEGSQDVNKNNMTFKNKIFIKKPPDELIQYV